MLLHDPERYEAHRLRKPQTLEFIAKLVGFTVQELLDGKEYKMSETIRTDVPPPTTTEPEKPKRGRPRGSTTQKKTAQTSQAASLLNALSFVSPVETDLHEWAEYVQLSDNYAIMYNGQIAAAHPIAEELTLSPHLSKLIAALKRCGSSLAITETDSGQLSIKGEKLRAVVPCFDNDLPKAVPDQPVYTGDFEALKDALRVCSALASENGERVVEASLLLDPNTCTGTDGYAMVQYWHGLPQIPPGTVISKKFAAIVAKQVRKITGIGASWNGEFATSLTLWFEGGAWLKTQCYEDRWPSIDSILNVQTMPEPMPEGLIEAIEAVIHFGERRAYFVPGFVQSHPTADIGAQYEVKGLDVNRCFNGKLFLQVAAHINTLDLKANDKCAYFFGGTPNNPIRGAIMGMTLEGQET